MPPLSVIVACAAARRAGGSGKLRGSRDVLPFLLRLKMYTMPALARAYCGSASLVQDALSFQRNAVATSRHL